MSLSCPAVKRWEYIYGRGDHGNGSAVQQTSDGGYIVVGWTKSPETQGDVYLVKTDNSGETLWTRTFGGVQDDRGYSVQQTSDRGYIVAGVTSSFGSGGSDMYVIRTDSRGEPIWTHTYGGTGNECAYSVCQTADRGYMIAGSTTSFGAGGADAYLVKTDASGETLWTRTFGGSDDDCARSVQQTSDRGCIVAGSTKSYGAGLEDACLVKTSASGSIQWSRTFGGSRNDYANSVRQTRDGGYIVAGQRDRDNSWDCDLYLVKTNAAGEEVWSNTYGWPESWAGGDCVCQTRDGGYAVVGYTGYLDMHNDIYFLKVDSRGIRVWSYFYQGVDCDYGHGLAQTRDGGYIIVGTTERFSPPRYPAPWDGVFLIKTDADGRDGWER